MTSWCRCHQVSVSCANQLISLFACSHQYYDAFISLPYLSSLPPPGRPPRSPPSPPPPTPPPPPSPPPPSLCLPPSFSLLFPLFIFSLHLSLPSPSSFLFPLLISVAPSILSAFPSLYFCLSIPFSPPFFFTHTWPLVLLMVSGYFRTANSSNLPSPLIVDGISFL